MYTGNTIRGPSLGVHSSANLSVPLMPQSQEASTYEPSEIQTSSYVPGEVPSKLGAEGLLRAAQDFLHQQCAQFDQSEKGLSNT